MSRVFKFSKKSNSRSYQIKFRNFKSRKNKQVTNLSFSILNFGVFKIQAKMQVLKLSYLKVQVFQIQTKKAGSEVTILLKIKAHKAAQAPFLKLSYYTSPDSRTCSKGVKFLCPDTRSSLDVIIYAHTKHKNKRTIIAARTVVYF